MTTQVRRAARSHLRALSLGLLISGTVVGVAASIWASWPVRIGIGVLLVTAWVALRLSWREQLESRLAAHQALMQQTKRSYATVADERQITDRVVAGMRDKNAALAAQLGSVRADLADRHTALGESLNELSRLRGDNEALRHDVTVLRGRVDRLTGQVQAWGSDADGAEVLSLPRRPMKHQRRLWSDDDVWADDEMPSVVDLIRADATTTPEAARRQA